MAYTASWYLNGLKHVALGDIKWATDPIYAMLTTGLYTPNIDTHEFRSAVTNEVANGSGYTSGGIAITGRTLTIDTANHNVILNAADTVWTAPAGATLSANNLIMYKQVSGAATDLLLGILQFGAQVDAYQGPLTVNWDDVLGALYLQVQ